MRRLMLCSLVMLLSAVLVTGCGTSMFGAGTAKRNALQALVTTTRSAVLLMTAAGIAYDAGAFGPVGSTQAEATWAKIAQQSVLMSNALNEWQAAVKANKDASAYQSIVAQGLAVLGALLPAASRSALIGLDPALAETFARSDLKAWTDNLLALKTTYAIPNADRSANMRPMFLGGGIESLSRPDTFRTTPQFAGGAH